MKARMPSEDLIRKRAFELYKERGQEPGHCEEDWEQARFEIMHLPLHVVRLRPLGPQLPLSPRSRRRADSGNFQDVCCLIARIRCPLRRIENN